MPTHSAVHRRRDRRALRAGDLVVLDPDAPAVQHGVELAHVAGGPDAARRRLEVGRACDAAALPQLEPGGARQHHVGHHAGAHHDHVGGELAAGRADHALHPRLSLEPLDPVAADELDAVISQQRSEEPGGRGPEVRRQRRVLEHHHRAAAALRGQRGCHLAGDVGAADQHHVLGVDGVGPDRVRVAERAQVVDAVELAAVDAQPAHVRAGREQRDAELDDLLGR
jgi:hypothetical protein